MEDEIEDLEDEALAYWKLFKPLFLGAVIIPYGYKPNHVTPRWAEKPYEDLMATVEREIKK